MQFKYYFSVVVAGLGLLLAACSSEAVEAALNAQKKKIISDLDTTGFMQGDTTTNIYPDLRSGWGSPLAVDVANPATCGTEPIEINSVSGLIAIGTNADTLQCDYQLTQDIDLIDYSSWDPIGTQGELFLGTLDGKGYRIHNLRITEPDTDYVGLFARIGIGNGQTVTEIRNLQIVVHAAGITGQYNVGALAGSSDYATIHNVQVEGGTITGESQVGGLVGELNHSDITESSATEVRVEGNAHFVGGLVGKQFFSDIRDSHTTGAVSSNGYYVGGLVGYQNRGKITDSSATGAVTGTDESPLGGLVGKQDWGVIINSSATGTVTAQSSKSAVGGLVGLQYFGNIHDSHATGAVRGSDYFMGGGLVGYQNRGEITDSYATGEVTGTGTGDDSTVGGLVGLQTSGRIESSYAIGKVTGTGTVGGLTGSLTGTGSIENSYAIGEVTGTGTVGGLAGLLTGIGSIENSYYDGTTTTQEKGVGNGSEAGITPYYTVNGQVMTTENGAIAITQANFDGDSNTADDDWNFINTWSWVEDGQWPILKWQWDLQNQ